MGKRNTRINKPLIGGEVIVMLVLAGSVVVTMDVVITKEDDCGSVLSVIRFWDTKFTQTRNTIIITTIVPAKINLTIIVCKNRMNIQSI